MKTLRIINITLIALFWFMVIGGLAHSADATLAWDSYTDQASIDGYYIYMTATSPVIASVANRIATVTNKAATQQTVTGITIGPHFFAMSAYKGSIESDLSNEATGTIRPKKPTGLIITILP